jgi:phospholipid transport system substrate-binding protein
LDFTWFYFIDNGEKMKRLYTILLALTLLVSQAVFANEAETVEEGPVEVIQSTIVKLNQLTTVATYSPQMMNFLVEQEVVPLFDFDYIADEVLLAANTSLSEDEVKFFSNKLKKNIMGILLSKLAQAKTSSFRFISARPLIGGNIIVKLKVNGYSPYGIYIDLLFHQSKVKKWQIFDIVLNNDSLINYYQKMVLIKVRRYGIYGMLGRI